MQHSILHICIYDRRSAHHDKPVSQWLCHISFFFIRIWSKGERPHSAYYYSLNATILHLRTSRQPEREQTGIKNRSCQAGILARDVPFRLGGMHIIKCTVDTFGSLLKLGREKSVWKRLKCERLIMTWARSELLYGYGRC